MIWIEQESLSSEYRETTIGSSTCTDVVACILIIRQERNRNVSLHDITTLSKQADRRGE